MERQASRSEGWSDFSQACVYLRLVFVLWESLCLQGSWERATGWGTVGCWFKCNLEVAQYSGLVKGAQEREGGGSVCIVLGGYIPRVLGSHLPNCCSSAEGGQTCELLPELKDWGCQSILLQINSALWAVRVVWWESCWACPAKVGVMFLGSPGIHAIHRPWKDISLQMVPDGELASGGAGISRSATKTCSVTWVAHCILGCKIACGSFPLEVWLRRGMCAGVLLWAVTIQQSVPADKQI